MADKDKSGGSAESATPQQQFVNVPSDVGTIFADTCIFAADVGGTIRMQFVEFVPGAIDSPSPGMKVRYVGTLAMPAQGWHNMLEYLNSLATKKTDGD